MEDKITPQSKLQRFLFRYRDIFTHPMSKDEFLYSVRSVKEPIKNGVVYFEGMSTEPLLAAHLMQVGEFKNVQLLNAYKLIEIYLDKDEEWESISDIQCQILVITLGFAEFPNKQQGNIICQAIEQQISRGGQFWLFVRGMNGLANYPEVRKCLEDRHFTEHRYQYSAPVKSSGDVQ